MHPLPRHMTPATLRARAILTPLAERGLLRKPLHIVFGPSVLVDCLSPYCRDLEAELQTWAKTHQLVVDQQDSNDQLYAIAEQFCGSQQALRQERVSQERLLGITNSLIDSSRLDPRALDSRIQADVLRPSGSVFVLASSLNPGLDPETALTLIELVASSLQSIAMSWPKEQHSEYFVDSLRQKNAVPLHLLDTHERRRHASVCRYLNNLSSPVTQPDPPSPSPPQGQSAKAKPLAAGPRIRIKA